MTSHIKAIHPMKYMRDFLARDIRPDGRSLLDTRPTVINVSSISTADGSAVVKIGNTSIICGIKAELCSPTAEEPDKGYIVPNVELPPLCSSQFKSGPPGEQAQVYNHFMAEVITNADCLDLRQLVVAEGKLVWVLYCDMVCLDYDGGILDACVAALFAALKTASLPEVQYDPVTTEKIVLNDKRKKLDLTAIPISSTFATFDEHLLLADPTGEEEDLSLGTVTVVLVDDRLCCVHKPGGSRISETQLEECILRANKRAQQMRKLIEASIRTLE